jgi:hypothetical protein
VKADELDAESRIRARRRHLEHELAHELGVTWKRIRACTTNAELEELRDQEWRSLMGAPKSHAA